MGIIFHINSLFFIIKQQLTELVVMFAESKIPKNKTLN